MTDWLCSKADSFALQAYPCNKVINGTYLNDQDVEAKEFVLSHTEEIAVVYSPHPLTPHPKEGPIESWMVVAHAFTLSTLEAEADRYL